MTDSYPTHIETNAEKLLIPRGASAVLVNSVSLQADAANYEDIVHGLDNQFPSITLLVSPPTGIYQDLWVDAGGVLSVVYLDANTLRLYNEGPDVLVAGRVRVLIVKQ